MTDETEQFTTTGRVKWFDQTKGFGFIVTDLQTDDVLLHANVLRNFGQSSVADGSEIEFEGHNTDKGAQATKVLAITPPKVQEPENYLDIEGADQATLDTLEFQPCRIKWFDKAKGFGFANAFGSSTDIFVHVEILRKAGFAETSPGEAMAVKVLQGNRGLLAVEVAGWESISTED